MKPVLQKDLATATQYINCFWERLQETGATQRFQMTKTRQKLNLKTREIDWLYIWLQHFDTF